MQVVAPWSRRPGSPKLRPKNDRPRTKPTGSQTSGSRKVEKWRWARCGQTKWTQPYSTYFSKGLISSQSAAATIFFLVRSNFEDSIAASWTKELRKHVPCLYLRFNTNHIALVCARLPLQRLLIFKNKLLGGEVLFETSLHFETTKDHPSSL